MFKIDFSQRNARLYKNLKFDGFVSNEKVKTDVFTDGAGLLPEKPVNGASMRCEKNFQNFRCDLCGPTWRETFFELLRGFYLGMIRTKINKLPFKPANRPKNQEDVRTVLKCEILCRYSHVPNLIVCSFEISKSVEKILYDVIIIYCWKLFMMSNRTSFSKRPSTFR